MNRDDSSEEKKTAVKRIATNADVPMGKRVMITKSAKRFERYGQIADGKELVRLIGEISGSLEGKPTETEVIRHRAKAPEKD